MNASENVCLSSKTGSKRCAVKVTRLTQQRHWLCTASMVLLPVQPLSMYSFKPIRSAAMDWLAAREGRESTIVQRIGNGSVEPLPASTVLGKPR
jgi:hypothetical protein